MCGRTSYRVVFVVVVIVVFLFHPYRVAVVVLVVFLFHPYRVVVVVVVVINCCLPIPSIQIDTGSCSNYYGSITENCNFEVKEFGELEQAALYTTVYTQCV